MAEASRVNQGSPCPRALRLDAMATTYLHRLIAYNNWANRGLLEFLATLPPAVRDERVAGVFGSIRETFKHLLSSELSYHRNLSGLPRNAGVPWA